METKGISVEASNNLLLILILYKYLRRTKYNFYVFLSYQCSSFFFFNQATTVLISKGLPILSSFILGNKPEIIQSSRHAETKK